MIGLSAYISLTLMSGPRDGETLRFDLQPGTTVLSFGRRDSCDVCLNYDSQVSRIHAQLTFDGQRFLLEDLNSRNGTFIDRQRLVEKMEVKPGALFRVGRTWLRLDQPPPDETQSAQSVVNEDDLPF
jgi:pSer/pThr/pTyr-binding forkhead associated (FHA) protein